MKILMLSNLYPPHVLGGYEILCAQVAEQLRARGHEVSVLTTRSPDGLALADAEGVHRLLEPYRPFSVPAPRDPLRRVRVGRRNAEATRLFLAGKRFDLAFVWSQLRLTLGPLRALQEAGIPTALTLNDEHLAGYLPIRAAPAPRRLAAWALDRTLLASATLSGVRLDAVTCISHRLKQDLVRRGLPVEGARVIHQGIPVERFPLKSQPGTIGRPLRLLYVGQLHPYKGVHTLLEAAHRLAGTLGGASVEVSVVGDGPADYKARLEREAAGPARVRFAGKQPHHALPAVYRDHDIFVFPSTWAEPFGLTHLEAMASGTPVVSTADGGHAELMRDGENALVFGKDDAAHLAARLAELVTTPGLAPRLAANARADVERRFSMDRYVSDVEGFLAAAAGAAA